MKFDNRTRAISSAFVVMALFALGLVSGQVARAWQAIEPGEEASASGPESGVPLQHEAPRGATEGIPVYGEWVIEVRDPDGTLVSRHEFHNSLTSEGGAFLARLLGRRATAGLWQVQLIGTRSPCVGLCLISEPTAAFGTNKTLSVSAPTAGPNAGKLVLAGTITAGADGDVNAVATVFSECAPTVAPSSNCDLSGGDIFQPGTTLFTRRDLPSQVNVLDGQEVAVSVAIGFSSPAQ